MAASHSALCPTEVVLHPRVTASSAAVQGDSLAVSGVGSDARRWFALAIGSLVVAGLLSLSVVIGRLPGIARFIDDPLFFKRCLVVHVDLALVVWFYAFLAGLNAVRAGGVAGIIGRVAFWASVSGVVAMLGGALMRGAPPVLANYIPVIDHPLFLAGLGAFLVGTLVFLIEGLGRSAKPHGHVRYRAVQLPPDAAAGLQAASVAFVLAAATWLATRTSLPAGLDPWTRFEFSAWGAGHVLQVANVAAMVAVWLWLLARATGRPVLQARGGRLVFTVLIAPHFAMPLLTAQGAMDSLYHTGATQLMRWGIFPVVLVVFALCVRHLRRHALAADPLARMARAGFAASAGLTLLGFILGACIRSSTTLVPAHYHASLGGVTVAFMAAAYLVCAAVDRRAAPVSSGENGGTEGRRRARGGGSRWQLALFGLGQSVFALGFGIGGFYGLGRKAYAGEQHVRTAGELVGLGVMGLGGLVATAAGVWFLVIVLRAMRGWWSRPRANEQVFGLNSP